MQSTFDIIVYVDCIGIELCAEVWDKFVIDSSFPPSSNAAENVLCECMDCSFVALCAESCVHQFHFLTSKIFSKIIGEWKAWQNDATRFGESRWLNVMFGETYIVLLFPNGFSVLFSFLLLDEKLRFAFLIFQRTRSILWRALEFMHVANSYSIRLFKLSTQICSRFLAKNDIVYVTNFEILN